ncbi:MAG: exodeoxyribonuclease VII large subunit [Oscillospiraceae bacterium]|jgi:exodeoxyribonuclease VII large subunit|nr:exodeoxyribonuclease VII large subunit [Oscillospiraceae bacterium]
MSSRAERRALEVTELNEHIKLLLDGDPLLANILVRGEVSNYKSYPSGHRYFTLKDAESSLKCVMFKSAADKLRFTPDSGMKVLASGRISVYPRDGAYQLYVSEMTADGVGDLYAEFERLKQKLESEGLFDEAHKKPLPRIPGAIAVVTSGAGAAVHDIIRILRSRWSPAKVVILPVRVQGEEAPREIVSAIKYANLHRVADVIITGRGGGSIEDLWAFNDERVARAIYESELPVISAVGHEPDVTIADFVADRRASTPSNAAEIAVPDMSEALAFLSEAGSRLTYSVTRRLESLNQRLDDIAAKKVLTSPQGYVELRRSALERLSERLGFAALRGSGAKRESLSRLAASLDALSPLRVLGRGYAITRKPDGTVVRSGADITVGGRVTVRLAKNELDCVVEDIR